MQVIIHPAREQWGAITQRPVIDVSRLRETVATVLAAVQRNGNRAVQQYTLEFDKVLLTHFAVTTEEIDAAETMLTGELKAAITQAAANIKTFHAKQIAHPEMIETMPGITCWRKAVGIEKVGLYIPGGTAPLFSTILMLGIPAQLAACKEVILCSPPSADGKLHPAILFAAKLTGITTIFKIGGVQAIGAMAYGTETVPLVNKIFGPGNQYVTCAKQLVQEQGIAIDMPAGPSEICVWADETADPAFVAADLLSQAEHGPDSQVLLICNKEQVVQAVMAAIETQLTTLPRADIAQQTLSSSKIIVLENTEEAIDLINFYAPEHLIISCKNEDELAERITNAGSVFVGSYSSESVGDYASGTNHTLPTNGFAKAYSGVSVDSFVKKITFQKLTREGLENIAHTVIEMAEAEGLQAHANAIKVRMTSKEINTDQS